MTFADLLAAFGIMLPLLAGIILVGGAIIGSFLPRDVRKTIEHWVLWPLVAAAGLSMGIWGFADGGWSLAVLGMATFAVAGLRLAQSIKTYRAGKAPTNPTGTGTTA